MTQIRMGNAKLVYTGKPVRIVNILLHIMKTVDDQDWVPFKRLTVSVNDRVGVLKLARPPPAAVCGPDCNTAM